MVVDLVPIQEDIDDIYNIKLKLILYPKYLLKSWYNYREGLKIISFSEASIISLSFFAHDAPLIV